MKKNLRIVSAAAAALLAVAPVAASAVSTVSAAPAQHAENTVTNVKGGDKLIATDDFTANGVSIKKGTILTASQDENSGYVRFTYTDENGNGQVATLALANMKVAVYSPATNDKTSTSLNNDNVSSIFDADANTAVNISAVAAQFAQNSNQITQHGAFSGNVTATVGNQNYTATLHTSDNNNRNTEIYYIGQDGQRHNVNGSELHARVPYIAVIHGVHFTMPAQAGKTVELTLPRNARFVDGTTKNNGRTKEVKVSADGVADAGTIQAEFYAYDATDMKGINFYAVKTGNVVTSGSVALHARNDGMLNVEAVYAAISHEYGAAQVFNDRNSAESLLFLNDIRDQLKKANISVDANGYFKAPASFSLNMTAKSNANGATATLPVTVTVDNAAASNTPASNAVSKTVMHIAAIYNKEGKQTNDAKLRAYNSVSVLPDTVTINGSKMYQVVENGQAVDKYVKASNIDGTSKTLKHNSYVYTQYGKKVYTKSGKTVKLTKKVKRSTLRKEANGNSVTVYGGALFNKQYYRIGKNQYIKVANFR